MKINEYGEVTVTNQEAFEALYNGKLTSLDNVYLEDIEQYNTARSENADKIPVLELIKHDQFDSVELFDNANQCNWFMPKDYCPNLIEFIYSHCDTDEKRDRVNKELDLFIQHGMLELLYYLKYLVNTMRENNIVWGVGRGSSVASYVLYILGVHKIDSIKYNLDIHEFLKEKENGT